jgi:hypothetical protein
MIRAEVHSDDHHLTASFDATPFFERATLGEIVALKGIGWGGNYQSDAVALFMLDKAPDVAEVFRYLDSNPTNRGGFPTGFECRVCEKDVARWVQTHRPEWFLFLFQVAEALESSTPRNSFESFDSRQFLT